MMLTMKKSLRRRARSEELDRERSEDLRRGTPAARHAAAVLLGRRGGKNGDADAHRAGGRARVRASREKGGRSRSEAKIAAARLNVAKARAARIAQARARQAWEQTAPTDYKPEQMPLF